MPDSRMNTGDEHVLTLRLSRTLHGEAMVEAGKLGNMTMTGYIRRAVAEQIRRDRALARQRGEAR